MLEDYRYKLWISSPFCANLFFSNNPIDHNTDIVIPVFGHAQLLQRCVESLLQTTSHAHIILVDDHSPQDDVVQFFHSLPDGDRITAVQLDEKKGFIGATRLGASLGKAQFILFLNSDIQAIEPGWLERMLPLDDETAVVGAKLLYPPERHAFVAHRVQHAGIARKPDGSPYHPFRGWPANTPQVNEQREVNAVTGGCMLVRREVWEKLGGWDDRFGPGVYEDVDFCWRVRKMGYKILYQPAACLYHYESASIDPNGAHSLYVHLQDNKRKLIQKWGKLESDEAIFFGDKTVRRWSFARKQLAIAQNALRKNDLKSAFSASKKALERADDLPEALLFSARLDAEQNKHDLAVQKIQKAITLNPLDWQVRLRLVDERIKAGLAEEASIELDLLEKVFPTEPALQERHGYLETLLQNESRPYPKKSINSGNECLTEPAKILQALLEADDLIAALKQFEQQFDSKLLDLVSENALLARSEDDNDLASGLEAYSG